jgi:transcriptional regulator PpsR
VNPSRARPKSLGVLDPEAAAALVAVSADITLVIDADGVIEDVSLGSEEAEGTGLQRFRGKAWVDTVTPESRGKVEALLRDAGSTSATGWRQVNHPSEDGPDVPVLYSAIRVGRDGRIVAVGRDLRAIAALQQRLLDAQQSMERDYSRLRHVETRYRLLFQMTAEPVLILDASSQRVMEANPAALQLFGGEASRVVGHVFPIPGTFEAEGNPSLEALLSGVRASGRGESVHLRLATTGQAFNASAILFRQDSGALLLLRLAPVGSISTSTTISDARWQLLKVAELSPDAFVVIGPDGRILTANTAFLDLAQLATEEQARGEALDRWLGRPGVDLSVLMANLRQHGAVRLFPTTVRGEFGSMAEVEISAVRVLNGEQPCFGFTIRNVGRRLGADAPRAARQLPRSVEQLTELIGRVSLKDLVRETTDVIERLCIEAALELTGDNRASAAEMLGLSRQSLYVKLRRYGLVDAAADPED